MRTNAFVFGAGALIALLAGSGPGVAWAIGRCNQALDPNSLGGQDFVRAGTRCQSEACRSASDECVKTHAGDLPKISDCQKTAQAAERDRRSRLLQDRWKQLQDRRRTNAVQNCVCGGTEGEGRSADEPHLVEMKKTARADSGSNTHGILCYCSDDATSHPCTRGKTVVRGVRDPLTTASRNDMGNAIQYAMGHQARSPAMAVENFGNMTPDQQQQVINRMRYWLILPAASRPAFLTYW